MNEIGSGSYVVLRTGSNFATHIFIGKSGKHYIVDVVPGRDPNAQDGRSRYYRDANGQSVKWVLPNGNEVTYSPHNCQRTIGVCNYVERGRANGKPYRTNMTRTNTPTANGLKFVKAAVFPDGSEHVIMSGSVVLDQYGKIKRATRKNEKGSTTFKQIKAVYR